MALEELHVLQEARKRREGREPDGSYGFGAGTIHESAGLQSFLSNKPTITAAPSSHAPKQSNSAPSNSSGSLAGYQIEASANSPEWIVI